MIAASRFQAVAPYLDLAIPFALALLMLFWVPSYMRKRGTGERLEKNIRLVKISAAVMLVGATVVLVFTVFR
jgi:amino acid transporter